MNDQQRRPKANKGKMAYSPTREDNAYKFAAWCARHGVRLFGGPDYGNRDLDTSIGVAAAQLMPAKKVARMGRFERVIVHACAGAWDGVNDGD